MNTNVSIIYTNYILKNEHDGNKYFQQRKKERNTKHVYLNIQL